MNKKFQILVILVIVSVLLVITMMEPALARPGGRVSSGNGGGWIGVLPFLIYIVVYIFLLPYAWYVSVKRTGAEIRTFKDLRLLAQRHDLFDWRSLENRIESCFQEVHVAWSQENLDDAAECMTNKYRKEQQSDYLDKWAKQGLINHCEVEAISNIQPLFLAHPAQEMEHEGSELVVAITAKIEDYLAKRDSGKIVKGEKGFEDVETIWTFVVQNGKWVVANIEDSSSSLLLDYARAHNELPVILEEYDGLQVRAF
jgi:hypothetical protein